jgi:hypothetical protein
MDVQKLLVEDELIALARSIFTGEFGDLVWAIPKNEFATIAIEELGRCLPRYLDDAIRVPKNPLFYWESLKDEFRLLLCTDDKKYVELRTKLEALGTKSQITLISTISAALATYVGVAASVLVPFCAIILIAVARVGKNAICKGDELWIPINPRTSKLDFGHLAGIARNVYQAVDICAEGFCNI